MGVREKKIMIDRHEKLSKVIRKYVTITAETETTTEVSKGLECFPYLPDFSLTLPVVQS